MNWAPEDLRCVIEAHDLKIAPFREDGATAGTPTWIWCVAVDDELFVRAYNGTRSRWYQAAARQGYGKIYAARRTEDVAFELIQGGQINDRIDDAYRAKYKGSPYLEPMIAQGARRATVKVVPIPATA